MRDKIEAHMRMEERYEGLSLIYGDSKELREKILNAIEKVKKETNLKPFVFEKISQDEPDIQSFYIEFHDDYHREGGDFFERLLKELNIKCEKDI
ncbi:MAG: hypothetical protein GXO02_06460 [Epsilonproteobacteria bacterium]|nr:hypothetical protein [Campylobacterota bacterium]